MLGYLHICAVGEQIHDILQGSGAPPSTAASEYGFIIVFRHCHAT